MSLHWLCKLSLMIVTAVGKMMIVTKSCIFHRMVEMLTGSVNSTLVIGSNKLEAAAPAARMDGSPSPGSPSHVVHPAAPASVTPLRKAVETSL